MKRNAIIFVAVLLAATLVAAQQAAVPDGTTLRVEVKKDLQAKKAKVGDAVQMEVIEDAKDSTGAVLVPKGTKLTGRVTDAQAYDKKAGQEGRLSILVTSAETKNGAVPLNAIMFGKIRPAERMAAVGISAGEGYRLERDAGQSYEGAHSMSQALQGVELKADPRLGSVMVAKSKNIVLESGTQMDIRHIMPAAPPSPPVQQ